MTDVQHERPAHLASDANPLPRKSNGDGYTVTIEELAKRLGRSVTTARSIVESSGVPYRPWFGGQMDIKPVDADRLVEKER